MTLQEVEAKIREIDPRFSVVPNPNRPGLANIFFDGANYDLHAISAVDVREEVDPGYVYTFGDGRTARHWSWPEIEAQLRSFLTMKASGELDVLYGHDD